jgi:O-antigen/teichoic acid export membrane protein
VTVGAVSDDLRSKVVRGVGWKIVTQLVIQGSRIAVGVVLAHLLTPREFGLAAAALVFTGIAIIFTDLSLGAALIQKRELTEDDRSTVFWTILAAGVLCTTIGILLSGAVADFFGEPRVAPLFAAISVTFTITALSATHSALLARELEFKSQQLREIAGVLAGAIAAVAVAAGGFGPWAIVAQTLCSAAVGLVLLWRLLPWRPRLTYSLESLRVLGSFGGKLFASRICSYFNTNADNLLVGRFLGASALGVYSLAYNLMFAPLARVAAPVQQVLFPAFARLQDDPARLGRAWLRGNRLSAALSAPAFLGMIVVTPDFVPVVLGTRWNEVVPVLQLLCLAGVASSLQTLNWSVLQARGEATTLLVFMLFSSAVTVGAFGLGLVWGVVGVAGLYAAVRTLLLPVYTWLACRTLGLPMLEFARSLRTVMELALVMFGAVFLARLGLVEAGVPAAARLVLVVLLGVAVYAGAAFLRAPELLAEARGLRRRAGTSGAAA